VPPGFLFMKGRRCTITITTETFCIVEFLLALVKSGVQPDVSNDASGECGAKVLPAKPEKFYPAMITHADLYVPI
jgi:hypothetical protein